MKPKENKYTNPDNPRHSIEWGDATWSEGYPDPDKSIRNRYDKEDGGFNLAASSEIPWSNFNTMILESVKRREFSNDEVDAILGEIQSHYGIRLHTGNRPNEL